MPGYVFVAQGDITHLAAHAIVYSTDARLTSAGQLTSAFDANVPRFAEAYRELGARLEGRLEAGDTFWIDTGRDRAPFGTIVVVAAAGKSLSARERAFLAAKRALERAEVELERIGAAKPWLIALPTLLAGDGGARHDRDKVASPQIQAAEEFVAARTDVDVAFVAYTEANYQVWVRARRNVRERLGVVPDVPDPSPELVLSLQRGECVVFAGSGMSSRSGLPSWKELTDLLADALDVPADKRSGEVDYLLDLAQWYRDDKLEPTIEQLIAERYTTKKSGAAPTLAQYLLAGLPARYYVTTNYDDLLESALESLRRHTLPIVEERHVPRTGSANSCYVVKLHGCASRGGPVVLSRDDYDDFFSARPAMALLLEGLLLNQSFFFIGYSLRDPDFRQVWSRIARMLPGSKRPAFATTFDQPARQAKQQWSAKGLELIDVPGGDVGDKARRLDRFLDRVAELVSLDPHLFLAEDLEASAAPEIAALRDKLLGASGDLITACHTSSGHRTDALALTDALRFYASHGWRGRHPGQLGELFAAVAGREGLLASERRELLLTALRFTENADDAQALRAAIEAFERKTGV